MLSVLYHTVWQNAIQNVAQTRIWYSFTINIKSKITGDKLIMKKFKIPKIPETTSKSIRFPNDVIDEVEEALVGTDCTFSAFVVEAVRVALENLKEEEDI